MTVGRRHRLWAPASAFTLFAALLLVFTPGEGFAFRGGLVTAGLYVVLLQVVSALCLVVSIDDMRDPGIIDTTPRHPRRNGKRGRRRRSSATFEIRRAVGRFYFWHPVPAAIFSFAAVVPWTAVAMGLLDRTEGGAFLPTSVTSLGIRGLKASEVALAALLLAVWLMLVLRGSPAVYGWVAGFSVGTALAQIRLASAVDTPDTVYGWAAFAVVLCFAALVVQGTRILQAHLRRQPT